jgi:diguanylate cyclase (GGDEF)-like protein/PAS domain S-box-containing protein/putative nucleotidyltransferase with HDIG domain
MLVTVNDALCDITGFERTELLGQLPPYPFWPPELQAHLGEFSARATGPSGTRFEVVLMRKDRERFDAEATIRPARGADGREFGHLITVTDVSDQRRAQREQAALAELGRLVAENAEPQEVFDGIAERVVALFGGDSGEIVRLDPEADAPVIVAAHSAGAAPSDETDRDDLGLVATVARTFSPVLGEPPERVITAPVIIAGESWGGLRVTFRNRPIPPDAERILQVFADLAALAVANASARETLARQATTDPVTGLANHRAFHEKLREEIVRARRHDRQLNLVLLDLDHFKQVNDTYGHPAGDRALREVARRLRGQARDSELIARIGGEEFAWLIPEADAQGAYQAAERGRRAVNERPFDGIGRLSISAGVAALTPELDHSGLVHCADRALYWAKDGGRDSTFLYTGDADALLSRHAETLNRVQAISTIKGLARTVDAKHSGTAQHSEQVAILAERLALRAGWRADRASRLREAAFLHDIGKIAARDDLLLKPGPLTNSEYAEIKHHADLSARIAATVLDIEQTSWIRGHHERWDGAGYPDGLAGEEIPDGAQILALADAYEAMTSERVYRVALGSSEALDECRTQSGRQFAPGAVSALLDSDRFGERLTSDGT